MGPKKRGDGAAAAAAAVASNYCYLFLLQQQQLLLITATPTVIDCQRTRSTNLDGEPDTDGDYENTV